MFIFIGSAPRPRWSLVWSIATREIHSDRTRPAGGGLAEIVAARREPFLSETACPLCSPQACAARTGARVAAAVGTHDGRMIHHTQTVDHFSSCLRVLADRHARHALGSAGAIR